MHPHDANVRRLHFFFSSHVGLTSTHHLVAVSKTINRISADLTASRLYALLDESWPCKNNPR